MKNSNLLSHEFDESLAFLGIIFSLILFFYAMIYNISIMYSVVGILVLMACLSWIFIRKNPSLNLIQIRSNSIYLLFVSFFLIQFMLSVLSIYFRPHLYERPLIYFILTFFMCGTVAMELFLKNTKISLFLFQILLIGVSIAWSQLLIFPSLLGVDPWFHQMFTLKLINTHIIPDGYIYSKLPLFHLFAASTSLITGLNYKLSTMFSISVSQIICNILFIFLLCRFLFGNYKLSLLASLLVVISNQHIYMSYWSIPNGFGTIFTLPIFYLLLKIKSDSPLIAVILSIFFTFSLILTHSLASMFMAIVLFVYWFGSNTYSFFYFKKGVSLPLSFCILFIVSMFSWWIFASGYITNLAKLIKWGFRTDTSIGTTSEIFVNQISNVPFSEIIFNDIGMFLFFALSFIGCFYMISRKYGNHNTFNFAIVGFTPLFLGFFSLLTEHSIVEHRWWYFAQIFLSIPLSVSFLLILNSIKNNYVKPVILFVLVVFISFFLIMSPSANVDNHLFSQNSAIRFALTESELCAIQTISDNSCKGIKTEIGSDRYFAAVNYLPINFTIVPIDSNLYNGEFHNSSPKFVLIRDYIKNSPFKMFQTYHIINYDLDQKFEEQTFYKVYDCKSASLFVNGDIT